MPKLLSIMGMLCTGKTTQADMLRRLRPGVEVFDTGEFLRSLDASNERNAKIKEIMATGALLPTEMLQAAIADEVNRRAQSWSKQELIVFCGSPRKLPEAIWWETEVLAPHNLGFDHVVVLNAGLDVLDKRRHLRYIQGGARQEEDSPAKFHKRIGDFLADTVPVLDYFAQANRITRINGEARPLDVHRAICEIIA